MRFNFLPLCICWLFIPKGYGQVDPSVVPPTPNVASLTKYVDFPVGTYSGIPSISIPLYEIKSGDITVPISLSYHALGVAVSDEASWVGLNWALNAGGVVTQQIHGLSDFATFGFFNSPPIIDTDCYGGPQSDPFNMQEGNNGFCYGHDMIGNYSMWRSQRSRVNGQVVNYTNYCGVPFDWEPDVFKFNFGQYSGKFVFNQDREIFLLDQENLKIQEQWEITSPEGIVYEFKKNEQETHNGQLASQSWYLTKIRSAVGDRTINFEYEEGSPASTHEDWTFSTSINRIAGGTTGSVTSVGSGTSTQSMRTYTPVYLKKISWENNYVEFVRETTEREDLRGEHRLKYIRVYNQSGALVKEYELVASYNVAVSNAPCPHVSYIDQAARDRDFKRLMLDQLVERSVGENLITRFDYNQTTLPQKTSLAKDYWGFYNGAGNTNLLPPFQQKIYADAGIDYYNLTGAFRDPDEARSQARILTKITYPTSGSTLFQYELNEHHNSTEQPVSHSYYVYKEVYAGVPGQSGPVTFDYNPRDPKYISAELRINGYCPSCTNLPAPSYIILKKNGTAVANLALSTLASNYPNKTTEVHQGSLHTISFNAPLNLILGEADGTFELSVQAPSSSNQFVVSADVVLTLLEVVTQKKKAGGLRITKQTHVNDPNDSKPLVTRVLYDNGSRSSGKLMRQPTFHSIIPIGGLAQYRLNISSSSLAPSMGVNGGIVGYSKVTVLKGNDGEFGKTELFYHNKADSFYTYTIRPAGLPVVPHEFNGKMKLKIDFARHGAVYDTVRVEENTYELGFKILIKALAPGGAQQCFSTYVNGILHYYPIYGNWVRLKSSQVEDFSSNGGSKTLTLKSFNYQPVSFYGDGRIYTLAKDIAVTDMPRHFNQIKAVVLIGCCAVILVGN